MSSRTKTAGDKTPSGPEIQKLLEQYGCGPMQFTGTGDALYERHLMFDNIVDPAAVGARERYEAVAHSVRDVLSQRWCGRGRPMSDRTPSAATTCPWSSSEGAPSFTTPRTWWAIPGESAS